MSKVDLDRFNDFMVEYKKEITKDYEKEIERLNNIINSIDTRLIEMGVDDEMLDVCEMYDVNGIELRKVIKELKGVDKE